MLDLGRWLKNLPKFIGWLHTNNLKSHDAFILIQRNILTDDGFGCASKKHIKPEKKCPYRKMIKQSK